MLSAIKQLTWRTCTRCDGTGRRQWGPVTVDCTLCNGLGKIPIQQGKNG